MFREPQPQRDGWHHTTSQQFTHEMENVLNAFARSTDDVEIINQLFTAFHLLETSLRKENTLKTDTTEVWRTQKLAQSGAPSVQPDFALELDKEEIRQASQQESRHGTSGSCCGPTF